MRYVIQIVEHDQERELVASHSEIEALAVAKKVWGEFYSGAPAAIYFRVMDSDGTICWDSRQKELLQENPMSVKPSHQCPLSDPFNELAVHKAG